MRTQRQVIIDALELAIRTVNDDIYEARGAPQPTLAPMRELHDEYVTVLNSMLVDEWGHNARRVDL